MSITDELRKWLDEYGCEYGSEKFIAGSFGSIGQDKLLAIADRIDAELAERYVALPLDAEDVPIHVGDVMEWPHGNGEFRVNGIGDGTLFYIDKDSGQCEWTRACDKRHYHTLTVEDVLREFADRVCNSGHQWGLDAADTIAEYVAKLRLAGDGE